MEIRERERKQSPKRKKNRRVTTKRQPKKNENASDVMFFNRVMGAFVLVIMAVVVNFLGGNVKETVADMLKQHSTLEEINVSLTQVAESVPVIGQYFDLSPAVQVSGEADEQEIIEDAEIVDIENIGEGAYVVEEDEFVSGFDEDAYNDIPDISDENTVAMVDEASAYTLASSLRNFLNEENEESTLLKVSDNPYVSLSATVEKELPEIPLEDENVPDNVEMSKVQLPIKIYYPVDGVITSKFGIRTDPINGQISFHHGLDIGADYAKPIKSIAKGIVKEVGYNNIYGHYVVIDHGNELTSKYAHCSSITVKEGKSVDENTTIAKIGSTGLSTGNHVHLEVKFEGKFTNPQLNLTW